MDNKITPIRPYESERIVDALVSGYRTFADHKLTYANVIEELVLDGQVELSDCDMDRIPRTLHLCLVFAWPDGEVMVSWLAAKDIPNAYVLEVLGEIDVVTYAGIVDGQETYAYTVDADDVRDLIMREVIPTHN